jgi:hypothetical protein
MKLTDEEIEKMLNAMEFEEPSMSFTRNVMEQVKLEAVPVALKTKVDKRIIYSIAAIFVVLMGLIFIYAVATTDLKPLTQKMSFNMAIDKDITAIVLKAFLFIDMVIVLFYFDRLLRYKRQA